MGRIKDLVFDSIVTEFANRKSPKKPSKGQIDRGPIRQTDRQTDRPGKQRRRTGETQSGKRQPTVYVREQSILNIVSSL